MTRTLVPTRDTRRPQAVKWATTAAAAITSVLAATALRRYKADIAAARRRVLSGARVITTRLGEIEYADVGRGPPVLVSHGAGGGWDQGLLVFRGNAPVPQYRVIAPSRFGYLRSPVPPDASPAAQADAYAALLDRLEIERACVFAVSAGALAGLQFALRHPERTAGLILLVPGTWAPPTGKRRGAGLMQSRFIANVVFKSDFAIWAFMKLRPRDLMKFVGVPEAMYATMTPSQRASVNEVLDLMLPLTSRKGGIMNDGIAFENLERYELERIKAPTLIVDVMDEFTYAGSSYTASHIPNARLVAFESGGHMLIGHEEEARRAITGFLEEHAKP